MMIIVRRLALLALFASVPVFAQERQHDQQQAQKEAPVQMEMMKEKGVDRLNSKGSEPTVEKNQPTKDAHQH